jgi:hypothetical protein
MPKLLNGGVRGLRRSGVDGFQVPMHPNVIRRRAVAPFCCSTARCCFPLLRSSVLLSSALYALIPKPSLRWGVLLLPSSDSSSSSASSFLRSELRPLVVVFSTALLRSAPLLLCSVLLILCSYSVFVFP